MRVPGAPGPAARKGKPVIFIGARTLAACQIKSTPNAAGAPGAAQLQQLVGYVAFYGIAACLLGLLVASGTLAFAHRTGRSGMEAGAKQAVIWALGGAALIAAGGGLIAFAMTLGGGVKC